MKIEGSVYRKKQLPIVPLLGHYILAQPMIAATRDAFVSYALLGIHDGGHEGLVFWAGREFDDLVVFTTVIVPKAEHSVQRVFVEKTAAADAARAARSHKLGILCQVHSHPCNDARHSSGDDDMIFMPYENMLSIVIPNYGIGFSDIADAGIHQFQRRRWVHCDAHSIQQNFHVVPTNLDLR